MKEIILLTYDQARNRNRKKTIWVDDMNVKKDDSREVSWGKIRYFQFSAKDTLWMFWFPPNFGLEMRLKAYLVCSLSALVWSVWVLGQLETWGSGALSFYCHTSITIFYCGKKIQEATNRASPSPILRNLDIILTEV